MSNDRPRAVDSKHKRDEALNVADFKIDDILSVPGDQLLAEVAEDFGDPAFLAAQFDSIALPALSSQSNSGVNRGGATATFPVQPAALGAVSLRALPRPSPATPWSFSRAAFAILAEWLAVPLRRRIFLGAFATLLLVAALTPGIYPVLVNRSADRIAGVSQDDPLTQLPALTLSRPDPAPAGPGGQSPVAPPTEERVQALGQPASAERKQPRPVTLQSAAVTVSPATPPAAARAPAQAPAAAKSRVTEEGGFFVQLSAPTSEAEAQSTFRTLKSKYAVLKLHEPVIRRKDEGQRGVIYAIQVGPFESRDDADRLCKQLKTAGEICFVTRN